MKIKSNEEKSALEIWKKALDNVTPQVEVKSRRVGGATFQVPTEIRPDRKESVSMKNLILFARKRGGKSMADKLAAEIMDAFNEQGGAYKRQSGLDNMISGCQSSGNSYPFKKGILSIIMRRIRQSTEWKRQMSRRLLITTG